MGFLVRLQAGAVTALSLFVDTSAWSLLFRRDHPAGDVHAAELARALQAGDRIVSTGIVLQELLQGFHGPKSRSRLLERFSAIPLIVPDRQDPVEAAQLRNQCRRKGIPVGTIDALLAQLCLRHDLILLTADGDLLQLARHCPLRVWTP